MLGKKLYKTSMLTVFKLMVLGVVIFFFNDFILNTYTYERFQEGGLFKLWDVVMFHYRHPYEFLVFFFLIIIPAFYYAFIRGICFYEKGFTYNKGFPFLNKTVPYTDISTYKMLHPKHIISVYTKSGDVFIIADNSVERVIAILDQHDIQGDLARDDYVRLISNFKKFVLVVLSFSLVLFLLKKFGAFSG